MKKYHFSIAAVFLCFLLSCSGSSQDDDQNDIETNVGPQKVSAETFGIDAESVAIRKGPGNKFDKVVNEKATKIIGKINYCEVDQSTKVEVLEKKNDWSKIRVVEPDWLKETYIGWIPSKYLLSKSVDEARSIGKLNERDYEIIKTTHNTAVQNFHVLLKRKKFDKEYIYQFTKQFRIEHCTNQCNVLIYDSQIIVPLIDVYPLEGNDYLKMADHLISASTFDATEIRDWYPYQDFHYKELGGNNLK